MSEKEGLLCTKLARDEGISTLGNSYIKEVLSEAKQDFAELLHNDDPLYWLHHIGQLEQDFKAKFEKWFGDSKE